MTMSAIPPSKVRALMEEIDAARSLLQHGITILESYTYAGRDADAVFVCLAGGAEKLLKLSAGVASLDTTGTWPSKSVMINWGHDITQLNRHVRSLIIQYAFRSSAPGYIAELLAAVDKDPYIGALLDTLGAYAKQGRFYNLDHLADATQPGDPPGELWERLHRKLTEQNPELLTGLTMPDGWNQARTRLNQHIVMSIRSWRELIVRSWCTGVLGGVAKQWGPQLTL